MMGEEFALGFTAGMLFMFGWFALGAVVLLFWNTMKENNSHE